ncbi:MAG: crotonase/enoyl-CoA hydratase family protein [bacterium]|nr:crotonase/enoyl-CoA hydratase family protein [bacterium]
MSATPESAGPESAIPESAVIAVEVRDLVATVWLDRPDKLNAMAVDFWSEFPAIIESLGTDPSVRAIVVAGRGRAFTVGIDLMAFAPMLAATDSDVATRQELYRKIKQMQLTFTSLADCPKPVIAAVHGYCLGGGIDLITACDIRLASADAVFSVRETRIGMVADVGTMQRLPRIVDPGRVAELVYTGKDFSAAEAAEMGLVSHVYPDVDSLHKNTQALAEEIAANSPLVVEGAKQVLRAGENMSTADALDYMAVWNAGFLTSNDLREALTAHLEKRPPNFTGT